MKTIPALLLALALAASCHAVPVTYNFYQGGFTEGSYVYGTFTAQDVDGDGYASPTPFLGEFVGGMAYYTGSSTLPAFSAPLYTANLMISSLALLGADFENFAGLPNGVNRLTIWSYSGTLGLGQLFLTDIPGPIVSLQSRQLAVVTRVQDSGTTASMLGLGLLGMLAIRRWHQGAIPK